MSEKIDTRIFLAAAIISMISLAPFDAPFYTFTRIAITLGGIAAIVRLYPRGDGWWIPFATITILFNPILPVYLGVKVAWMGINVVTALLFTKLYKNEAADSDWIDIYLIWVVRLMAILVATLIFFFIVANKERSDEIEQLFLLLVLVFASALVGIAGNWIFFGKAKVWITRDSAQQNPKEETNEQSN